MNPKISIVIPVKKINSYIRESIPHLAGLDYVNYDILILPDYSSEFIDRRVKIIPTGPVPPSQKRDFAASISDAEILAFIDDDAYPRRDWLKNAAAHFENDDVAAVGGPAITPENDSLPQKASGIVYSSFLASGGCTYRYVPKKKREVDDFPSVNLLVRKSALRQVGGFDTKYWPGEDTKLCLDITKKLGKKIIYDPDVVVYHHRRKLFGPHLKQVWGYGLHRGFFARKFPETSLRIGYFVPSLFILFVIFGLFFGILNEHIMTLYLGMLSLYLMAVIAFGAMQKDFQLAALVIWGIILTHLTYGAGFIRGIMEGDL